LAKAFPEEKIKQEAERAAKEIQKELTVVK
jgi:hypothetical protein